MTAGVQIRPATPEDTATTVRHRYPGEVGDHLAVYEAWLPGALASGIYLGSVGWPNSVAGSSAARA